MQIGQIFSRGSTSENVIEGKIEAPILIGTLAAVQSEPMDLPLPTGDTGKIFIEGVTREKGFWAVYGWSTSSNLELILLRGKEQAKLTVTRHHREDVYPVFGLPSLAEPGFAAIDRPRQNLCQPARHLGNFG